LTPAPKTTASKTRIVFQNGLKVTVSRPLRDVKKTLSASNDWVTLPRDGKGDVTVNPANVLYIEER
jgi:hypothetical protein